MKSRSTDPLRLDVEVFAKTSAHLEGQWPLSQLQRLAQSLYKLKEDEFAAWSAQGERRLVNGEAQIWLHLRADAHVTLQCQRCLESMQTKVTAQRSYRFVHGEADAAALDAEIEDDVLALTHSLNLQELIEDELLLALPLVPKHETCPHPVPLWDDRMSDEQQGAEDKAPHPFAALAALRRDGLPN